MKIAQLFAEILWIFIFFICRAERFGVAAPELTEEEKKAIRASRFGVAATTSTSAKLDGMLSMSLE